MTDEDQSVIEGLDDDLAALIQDEGATESRIEAFGENLKSLFRIRTPQYILFSIVRVYHQMESDKYKKALGFALRLEGASKRYATLSDRRQAFRETESVDTSDDTLRRWERRSMRVMAKKLYEIGRFDAIEADGARRYMSASENEDLATQVEALRGFVNSNAAETNTNINEMAKALWDVSKALTEIDRVVNGINSDENSTAVGVARSRIIQVNTLVRREEFIASIRSEHHLD